MKVSGDAVLSGPPDLVWRTITDPDVLARTIPGCSQVHRVGDLRFSLVVTLGVASIKGAYAGEIAFLDLDPPGSFTLQADGSGAPGTVSTSVAVRMTDRGDGTTDLTYEADAVVGGMIGGIGQRVLAGVARKTAGLFFAAIDHAMTTAPDDGVTQDGSGADGENHPAAAGLPVGVAGALAAPSPAPSPAPPRPAVTPASPLADTARLVAAGAVGAAAMLVGVLVGAAIGRRR